MSFFYISLLLYLSGILLFAILAAVNFVLFVSEEEYLVEFLLSSSDTSRVLAGDDVCYKFWEM